MLAHLRFVLRQTLITKQTGKTNNDQRSDLKPFAMERDERTA